MSDTSITEATLRASLQDIQLPAHAAGGLVADLTLIAGLSGVLALCAIGVFRMLSLRVAPPADQKPDLLTSLRGLPETERRVALLHLMRLHLPEQHAKLQDRLYRPDSDLDLDALEQALEAHV